MVVTNKYSKFPSSNSKGKGNNYENTKDLTKIMILMPR
jgi:hypothetical protein